MQAYPHARHSAQVEAASWPGATQAYASSAPRDVPADARAAMPRHMAAKPRKGWVVTASCVLAAFTVFVLLDTFAIGRVQQAVQEADLSSIVEAQGAGSTDSGAAGGGSQGGGSGDSGAVPSVEDDSDGDSSSADKPAGPHRAKGHAPGGKHRSAENAGASGSGKAITGSNSGELEEGAGSASDAGQVVGTYSDDNMSITVSKVRAYDTDIYAADVQVSSVEFLKTALAQNAFGRNLKDTTSNMAEDAGAILAINGDYYGFRDDGYVVRNGVLYRDAASAGTDALVVYGDGRMASASQDNQTAQQLVESGAWQVLSFGPTLVQDGALTVTADSEVSQSMGSNPRTAIGMISPLHYLVVVSDGRTGDDAGLSLYQLAQVMLDNGASYAYNLDGGGSTTMWFQGQVLNDPTSGNRSGERQVSDIVYFG